MSGAYPHTSMQVARARRRGPNLEPPTSGIVKFKYRSRVELEATNPTRRDGIEAEREARWRRSYVKMIQEAGKGLHMCVPARLCRFHRLPAIDCKAGGGGAMSRFLPSRAALHQ